jgi:phospholipid/cholesterol/gamma-HCH transport system permease protein
LHPCAHCFRCDTIDAIEASAVNPYRLLVATRILACILMLPLLTLAADACGERLGAD